MRGHQLASHRDTRAICAPCARCRGRSHSPGDLRYREAAVATRFASSTFTVAIPAMVPLAIAAATSTKSIRFRKRASASSIVVSLAGWPIWREATPSIDPALMARSSAVNARTAGACLWVFARIVQPCWFKDRRVDKALCEWHGWRCTSHNPSHRNRQCRTCVH
jgi:hypothetical protein